MVIERGRSLGLIRCMVITRNAKLCDDFCQAGSDEKAVVKLHVTLSNIEMQ